MNIAFAVDRVIIELCIFKSFAQKFQTSHREDHYQKLLSKFPSDGNKESEDEYRIKRYRSREENCLQNVKERAQLYRFRYGRRRFDSGQILGIP